MLRRLLYWMTDRLPARFINSDDGNPYLERYYLGSFLGLRAYIHRFVASDPDRGLHDHPWNRSVSLLLVGGYREIRHNGERHLRPGQLNYIRGNDFHRVLLEQGAETWSLFIHGKRVKGWGFNRHGVYIPAAITKDDNKFHDWRLTAQKGRVLRATRNLTINQEKP